MDKEHLNLLLELLSRFADDKPERLDQDAIKEVMMMAVDARDGSSLTLIHRTQQSKG